MKQIVPTFEEWLVENVPGANPQNTPGMGNVNMPSLTVLGSGDTFGGVAPKKKKKKRSGRLEPLSDVSVSRDTNPNG